jgi:hypothetical protein
MKVEIYFNLHKKCLSIRHRGKVIAHAESAHLNCVEFKVSEAGRQRVLRERRKNVHAVVRGQLVSYTAPGSVTETWLAPWKRDLMQRVTYNPYKYSTFVHRDSETIVHTAQEVLVKGRDILARL